MTNSPLHGDRQHGFTLLELLIATVMFLVIAGAALSLFQTEQPLLNRQQNFSALNISMRNSVQQMQLDAVNGGAGYYPGINMPGWPIPATISNQTTTPCNTASTYTYGSNCFDTLYIITMDTSTPPANLDNGTFTSNCTTDNILTNSTTPIYVTPPSTMTAATLATHYHNGDQLLIMKSAGTPLTTIMLTGLTGTGGAATAVTVSGHTVVKLTYNATNSSGINTSTYDPPGITNVTGTGSGISNSYCYSDWIMRLNPVVKYWVNTATASNPTLTRTVSGVDSVLAEQIVGFKVGAITWNTSDDNTMYSFNSSANPASPMTPNAGYNNQWWLIRSLQVVLIGRTTPNPGSTYTYRNGFDGGPYQVESEIATIDPRNMTMNQ